MARRTKEQKEQIRKSILEVSERLFSTDGFNETSTKKIAKEVGIAEGTIFNYFESKNEIFFQVFSENENFIEASSHKYSDTSFPSEIIGEYLGKLTNKLLYLPKRILTELLLSSAKLAKKRPNLFTKLAALDYKYIAEVEYLISEFIEKKMINKTNPKIMSEMVYSIFAFEIMIYLYEADVTKEEMRKNVSKKLKILFRENEEE